MPHSIQKRQTGHAFQHGQNHSELRVSSAEQQPLSGACITGAQPTPGPEGIGSASPPRGVMVKSTPMLASGGKYSSPGSATFKLCDFREVAGLLAALVSLSVL